MNIYRRSKSTELFFILVVVVFLLYGYYSMQDLRHKLYTKDKETDKTHHYAKLLREQLKVLYKHTGKLEQALKDEKNIHKTTKQELLEKVEEFQLNATKTKHEAVNRFNALDTDYKMLKANYEETYQNYAVLQQQHVRLNEAHKKILANAKSDCDKVKFAIENETLHLHSRIQALYRDNMDSHQLAQQYHSYYQDALKQVKLSTNTAHEYKEKMKYYAKQTHNALNELELCRTGKNLTTMEVPSNDTIPINITNADEEEAAEVVTTTEHSKLGNVVGVAKHWPTNNVKLATEAVVIPPLVKPVDGEMLNSDDDRGMNGEEDRDARSGANIELNELLENKPVHMPLSTRESQIKRNDAIQGNVDNRDIREVSLESDDELSQNFLNSNSSPE